MGEKATSIKQLIQQMIPENIGLIEGVVVKTSPLSIQVVNNPKMVVSGPILVIPKHLTDYKTTCTINTSGPPVLSGDTTMANEHYHNLNELGLSGATITVHNALKKGEKVYMLRFNGGRQYYVLDRVVS